MAPPKGYTLDQPAAAAPKLPAGYKLDQPAAAPAQQPQTFTQRARAYVDQLSTPQDDPNSSWVMNKLSRFGAGAVANTLGVVNHFPAAVKGFVQSITPDEGEAGTAETMLGPAGPMLVRLGEGLVHDPATTLGGLAGGMLAGEAAAPVVRGAVRVGTRVVNGAADAARGAVVGNAIDKPIPGEAVTPREQYQIAKDQGVQLDAADATHSPVASFGKKITDSSLGGGPKYKANFARNVQALQVHAEGMLDEPLTDPNNPHKLLQAPMGREEFGTAAKAKLTEDLTAKQDEAGQLYDDLSQSAGPTQPSAKGIQATAKKIVAENEGYYSKHPDMLTGNAKRAWTIVKNMADNVARPADTWSDLHMLRTDLMDLTRSPEIAGNRPEGWLKLMTSSVDDAMANGASGLAKGDLAKWRQANALYTDIKSTYDNPQHPLYHVIRQPDGLTISNQLANMKPAIARQFMQAAPELVGQLQRQILDRFLRPEGNDVPDLKNLPTRVARAPKEQVGTILTPKQMIDLENLARTSRQVHATDNASGTAIKGQAVGEASALGAGVLKAGVSLLTGNPAGVAEGLAPVGWYGVTRGIGKAMVSPAVVDRIMSTPMRAAPGASGAANAAGTAARVAGVSTAATKGEDRWAALGAAKLADHIGRLGDKAEISEEDVDALRNTRQGRQLLIQAGDLVPGSRAMRALVTQIQAQSPKNSGVQE